MADPFNPEDNFSYRDLRLPVYLPPPIMSANDAPGTDDDDEGPNASDWGHAYAAPSSPSVGRRPGDDPARSRANWLPYAAAAVVAVGAVAAAIGSTSHSTGRAGSHGRTDGSSALPLQQVPYYPRQRPLTANPYDHMTPDPHLSCPLCGTPYQRSPSGQGPSYAPRPRDAMIRHEHTREGPRCPACHRPTRTQVTQLSPTGAQTRFLSSGRREYITGYPSPPSSQQYRGGVTTANANTNSTSLPYGSPASSYGSVVATSGYQVSPAYSRTSERSQVTRTQPRDYPLQYPPPANRESPYNATYIASASVGPGVYPTPAPAASEQRATRATPRVTSGSLLSNSVTSQEAIYSGSTSKALVSDMIVKGFIKSNAVADVMRAVNRTNYVTDKAKAHSPVTHLTEQGVAVPAPHIHAAILESILPHVKAGSHVLDVGANTGLFAAMLHHCTGEDGVTISLQPSNEVIESAKRNLSADGLEQALQMGRMLLIKGDEKSGFWPCAPYDVILSKNE